MEHSFVVVLFIIFLTLTTVNNGAEQGYKLFVDSDEIDSNFYSSEDSFATISDDVKDLIASSESELDYDQSSVNPTNLLKFTKSTYDIHQNTYGGYSNFRDQGKCPVKDSVLIDNRCYWISKQPASWSEADKNCTQLHPQAFLAEFETHQETVSVLKYLTGKFGKLDRYWWLGGNDFEKLQDFKWTVVNQKVLKEDWCLNEPDYECPEQHCVHIDVNDAHTKYCLGNLDCINQHHGIPFYYICEM